MVDIFNVNYSNDCLTISLSSCFQNIDRAAEETMKFLDQYSADLKPHLFSISLIMREGLSNAIKHGNKCDMDKIVQYMLNIKDNNIIIEITDQGDGFDWADTIKKSPNPDSDHGRGLIIIRRYCTEYIYNSKGNKLILKKSLKN